jgi:hypothetical protein
VEGPPPPPEALVPKVEIRVADDLSSPHPVVRQALRDFRRQRKQLHYLPDGMMGMASPLDVEVSPEAHERAFRILDAIVRMLDVSGHKVNPWESYQERSHVVIDGEKIQFRIKEGRRKADRNPKDILASYFRPYGELRFRIWYEAPYKHEREWRDDKAGPLESRLNEIFAGFFQAAADQKRHRVEHAEAQRRQAEEQRREWQREEARRREEERIKGLRAAAQDWKEARLLRAYVEDLEARAQKVGVDTVYGRPVAEWARWARQVASGIDPLRRLAELEAERAPPPPPDVAQPPEGTQPRF